MIQRRAFLKTAGAAGIAATLGTTEPALAAGLSIAIVVDPADPVASAPSAKWAAAELLSRLQARKIDSRIVTSVSQIASGDICVMASGPALTAPAAMPAASRPPAAPESFCISNATIGGHRLLMASGRDARGLTYALLELADRLEYETNPAAAFQIARPITEQPANRIRSVLRAFVSEVEDKGWYYDRDAWRDYLTMLATHRFNRFNLSFGIGYDFVTEIRDSYFHFTYPFMLNVPGYNLQVTIARPFGEKPELLTDDERSRNLSMLQFISAAAVERGIDFQLGLWTHAWNIDAAPAPTHKITGLTPDTHTAYCRDAIHALLVACPAISGVTLRTHGESGVPEESYPFWKAVFSGISAAGRKIQIDQHAKGIDAQMIALAQETGMPTAVSPKYWAEHMGLPYHQAQIRPNEMPKPGAADSKGALMALSSGSRNFLRYGYGDLMREDRKHAVLHRIWPGTQRLLLWGDPLMAAAYGRASSFAGSDGVEWMEPLSFKGRKGSGLAGGRNGYAGITSPTARDWEKYLYTYRVWGRGIYNPDSSHDARRRYLHKALGAAADSGEAALALSSRILPTITTAHMPSAANANYWPEIYTNQSIVLDNAKDPYSDTPSPKRFGTTSPLDSQLFCTVDQCADELMKGVRGPSYSPIEVAAWLEELARDSETNLAAADAAAGAGKTPEHVNWAVDIAIQNNIGKFFAAKFRSGVLYSIYTKSSDLAAHAEALTAYRAARDAWRKIVDIASDVYRPDLTFGYAPHLRGTWRDRLAAIDRDIAAMEAAAAINLPVTPASVQIAAALATPRREPVALTHTPVKKFRAGVPVAIEAALPPEVKGKINLVYRRVNQAEKWVTLPMEPSGEDVARGLHAAIPADYIASPYPLQYYFEIWPDSGAATLYPGLQRDYSSQPYFLIRKG
jgi:hypothetical protein